MNNSIPIPKAAWHADTVEYLDIPPDWMVSKCSLEYLPALTEAEISDRISSPIGTVSLEKLAEGKKEALILVEDHTRPIKCNFIMSILIRKLKAIGFNKQSIRILVANGTHRPMTQAEKLWKFGKDICASIDILAHDCHENLDLIGETSRGTPLYVNRNLLGNKLLIGVSGIYPHGMAGFSGGAKIVLPGASGIDSIEYNHRHFAGRCLDYEHSSFRKDMEEAARIVGLDYSINSIINSDREVCAVFAGDVVEAHRAACAFALSAYKTKAPRAAHILLINSYPMDMELFQAAKALEISNNYPDTDCLVLIADCPDGFGHHALCGPGGRMFEMEKAGLREKLKNKLLIIYSKNIVHTDILKKFPESTQLAANWEDAVGMINEKFKDVRVKDVVLFPTATIQIPEFI